MAAAHAAASRLRYVSPRRRVGALGRAAGVGHDDGEPAGDRLGDSEAVRLVRAPVHENVGRGHGLREAHAVLLEAHEADPGWGATFEARSFRSVSEQYEHGLASGAHPLEGVEHDVPPLFDREAAHADEQRGPLAGAVQELSPSRSVSDVRPERAPVHAEGSVDDVPNTGGPKAPGLRAAGDEGRVERRQQRPDPMPEGRADPGGHGRPQGLREHGLDIGAHVVGVPEGRPHG